MNNFSIRKCKDECCKIYTKEYTHFYTTTYIKNKFKQKKAGVFIHSPKENRVLLVQSGGQKWGAPKGSMDDTDLSIKDCAIRELFEETGIRLTVDNLNRYTRIGRCFYYYIQMSMDDVDICIQDIQGNDASGISWIKIDCIRNVDRFELTSNCRKLFQKFLF